MMLLWRVIPSAFLPITPPRAYRERIFAPESGGDLRQRDIFTPRCRQLLEEYEQGAVLTKHRHRSLCRKPWKRLLAPVSNGG